MMTEATGLPQPPEERGRRSKVLLVDDHPIVREGLARLIRQEPDLEVCGEAPDEPAAWALIIAHSPEVVVVDLSLRSGDGLELIKRIRGEFPKIAILVLSMHDELYFIERSLRAGAWGYLTKQEASDKVLTAIRTVLGGQIFVGDRLSPALLKRLLDGGAEEDSIIGHLSDRELQVFQLIGSGHGTQEIAAALHLSVKTIETYQAHIREKLNLKDSRKLVQFAVRWTVEHETN